MYVSQIIDVANELQKNLWKNLIFSLIRVEMVLRLATMLLECWPTWQVMDLTPGPSNIQKEFMFCQECPEPSIDGTSSQKETSTTDRLHQLLNLQVLSQ